VPAIDCVVFADPRQSRIEISGDVPVGMHMSRRFKIAERRWRARQHGG
jgi:hypothetical protein